MGKGYDMRVFTPQNDPKKSEKILGKKALLFHTGNHHYFEKAEVKTGFERLQVINEGALGLYVTNGTVHSATGRPAQIEMWPTARIFSVNVSQKITR